MTDNLKIDTRAQNCLWKIGDALAKYLRSSDNGLPGDTQWTVRAEAERAWVAQHPQLPLVRDDKGMVKEDLLQLHIEPVGGGENPGAGGWLVVAQNKLISPETHAAPKTIIVAKEDQPPGDSWDTEAIGQAAANFFKQQKNELIKAAQALQSPATPGSGAETPPQGAGFGGMPVANGRLRRVAGRISKFSSGYLKEVFVKRLTGKNAKLLAFASHPVGENFHPIAAGILQIKNHPEFFLCLSRFKDSGEIENMYCFELHNELSLHEHLKAYGGRSYLRFVESLESQLKEKEKHAPESFRKETGRVAYPNLSKMLVSLRPNDIFEFSDSPGKDFKYLGGGKYQDAYDPEAPVEKSSEWRGVKLVHRPITPRR